MKKTSDPKTTTKSRNVRLLSGLGTATTLATTLMLVAMDGPKLPWWQGE